MKSIGAILGMLGGFGEETAKAVEESLGRKIVSVRLDDKILPDGALVIEFEDQFELQLYDDARSCCESRYMTTDDELSYYAGSTLMTIEIVSGPDADEEEYGDVHEQQFLIVTTSKGSFTIETHNIHNGYYGGFYLKARFIRGRVK